jgi:hypothetical protein
MVVDDQDPGATQVRGRLRPRLLARVLQPEAGAEVEHAALARDAVDADLAVHQRHEMAADGQPQTGAAETPARRRIGLAEGLEQALALHGVDADAGVAHLEAQHHRALLP